MQRMVSAGWFSTGATSVYHKPLGASHFAGPFVVYATNEAIKKNRS